MTSKQSSIIKFSIATVLLLVAYIPTIRWMVDRWMAAESYYSHGFFIPLVSLFIAWQRRDNLKKINVSSSIVGLWIVVIGLITHVICASLKVYFVSGFSLCAAPKEFPVVQVKRGANAPIICHMQILDPIPLAGIVGQIVTEPIANVTGNPLDTKSG